MFNLILILCNLWAGFSRSVAAILEVPFGGTSRTRMNRRLYSWADSLLKMADLKVEVQGTENLDIQLGQRYVVMSNHSSYYDIPITMHVFQDYGCIRMIAKKELFQIPVWGLAMRHAEFVFIDRKDRHQSIKDIERAKQLMETGVMFWIAPEGTRSPNGQVGPFKTGGVKLAMDMDAIIIPIGIKGAFEVMSKASYKINRHRQVIVRIGKPFPTSGLGKNQRKTLTNQLREEIARLAGKPLEPSSLPQVISTPHA